MTSRILKTTIGRPKRFAVLLILLLSSLNAVATQQLMERLEYGGQEYFIGIESKGLSRPLWYFPLNSYLKREGITLIKRLLAYQKGMSSACWRGYVGNWSIHDNKFFLLRLNHDPYTSRGKAKTYPLSVVNPDWKSPVFANWYSGSFWLCKRIAYEFHYIVPVYQVEIKQGKVLKVVDFPHWLRDAAMKSGKMKKQLAAYRKQNLKPYQIWDESLCQNFFRCIRRVKPGMTLAEVEENMKMFDPDGENFKAAKTMKLADSGADGILRFYVFKLKKNAASKDDIFLDLQFHAGKLKELRIGLNDKQKSESANKRQNAGNRRVKTHTDKLNKKAPSSLKDEPALIDKIKSEIARYDKIRREILAKYPELNVYRLRVHFYSKLGDYFRARKEYNDFLRSMDQTQKNNLKEYLALQRKKYMANSENSDEYHRFKELFKLMKQYNPDNRVFAQFDRVFNFKKSGKTKLSASEQQQLDELGDKLSNPDLLNAIFLSGHYNGGFIFYESCLRAIVEKPLKEQRRKISQLINALYKLKDNKLDNEEKLFVKNCYRGLESDDVRKKIPLERYYRIEALLACLKKPQLRETIKLRLKDNYALRKTLISLLADKIYAMPADRHAWRDKRAEKTRGLLNYDDFDKYWANLEKVCGKLLEDVFVKAYKRSNCSPEQVRLSQVAGRVFIECLFDIDAQGAVEVSGVFPPARMKDVIAGQLKPDPAIQELNKLKQFALACHMFAHDNNGNLPDSIDQLKPYLGKLDISNITLVGKSKKLRDFKRPSAVIMAVSTKPLKDGRYTAAFVDGHCKFIAQEELPDKLEETK